MIVFIERQVGDNPRLCRVVDVDDRHRVFARWLVHGLAGLVEPHLLIVAGYQHLRSSGAGRHEQSAGGGTQRQKLYECLHSFLLRSLLTPICHAGAD
jgi:hypothetical protein